jgi:hypothetical protein
MRKNMTPYIVLTDDPVRAELIQKEIAERMAMVAHEREATTEAGLPALKRLIEFADNDYDDAKADQVRRLLLSLYNGYRFPFHFRNLRFLDKEILGDCLSVIKFDAFVKTKEVHEYFPDGEKIWERWAKETELDKFYTQTKLE